MSKPQVQEAERALVAAFAVPPILCGAPPQLDTARQRADYIAAMAEAMHLDPLDVADRDPAAQRLILRDQLLAIGALR